MSNYRKSSRDGLESSAALIDALVDTFRSRGLTDQARRLDIARHWTQAVGAGIARRTEPLSFSRGVLLVKTASAAWQNELTFLKDDIIERLNKTLGMKVVKDFRVVAGKRMPSPPPSEQKPVWLSKKPRLEDQKRAEQVGESISDEGVRSDFVRLMELAHRAERHGGRHPTSSS